MNARRIILVDFLAVVVCLVSAGNPLHSEDRSSVPIISRGYIGAPNGTVMLGGDPVGGATILEMRILEGQVVARDQVLVVLSDDPAAEISLKTAERHIETLKLARESLLTGPRAMEVSMFEQTVEGWIASTKLAALQRKQSGKPPDERQMEDDISERRLDIQKGSLQLMKQNLANSIAANKIDIAYAEAKLALARANQEATLVRSPLDGVIVALFARRGESVPPTGIAKIVDMRQLRVLADVDELRVGNLKLGGRAQVTFRGDATVHKGKISNIAPALKWMQQADPSTASASDERVVQVEVELDDASSMPHVLGREARITFLLDP